MVAQEPSGAVEEILGDWLRRCLSPVVGKKKRGRESFIKRCLSPWLGKKKRAENHLIKRCLSPSEVPGRPVGAQHAAPAFRVVIIKDLTPLLILKIEK